MMSEEQQKRHNRYIKRKKLIEFYDHIRHIDFTEKIRISTKFGEIYDNFAYLQEERNTQYVLYYIPLKHNSIISYYVGIARISPEFTISLKSLRLDEYHNPKVWIKIFRDLAKFGMIDMHIRMLQNDETSIRYIMKPKR